MRLLSSALYCEGSTDAQFLRPLLLRLCETLAVEAREPVEVPDMVVLDDEPRYRSLSRDERIDRAAQAADGAWMVLFIHADADGRDGRAARAERVQPALDRMAGLLGDRRQAVAVVPIRMTDAWVLADTDALRAGVGTTLDDASLGLTQLQAHGAERAADPKALLRAAFATARPRARQAQLAGYLGRIGELASFDRLRQLSAFQQLDADLRAALRMLSI